MQIIFIPVDKISMSILKDGEIKYNWSGEENE